MKDRTDTTCDAPVTRSRGPRAPALVLAALAACATHAAGARQQNQKPPAPAPANKPAPAAPSDAGGRSADGKAAAAGRAEGEEAVRERRVGAAGQSGAEGSAGEETAVESGAAAEGADAAAAETDAAALEELRAKIGGAKSDAERALLRRALVERLVGLGRRAEAVTELRSMLAEERFDPPYFFNTGNALARLGESGAAVEAYRKATGQRRGNYARAQHNLGVVLVRLGRWEEAQEALTAALRLESYNYADASYNLGRLHALRGEAGLAIAEWARTLRLRPDHAEAAVALARALAEDGDPERGISVLDALESRHKRRGTDAPREVAVARGEIVASRNVTPADERGGEPPAARVAGVSSSAAATPREARAARGPLRPLRVDARTYDFLRDARLARASGSNDEAVTLYRRAIRSHGGYFPPATLELGYALTSLQRDEEAVAALLVVTRRDGERYPIAFYHLGRLYEKLGRLELAGESFARAAALHADTNPQFLLDVSRVREKEGKAAEALAAMEGYARASEKLGGAPDWVPERLARLRDKLAGETTAPEKR